jgi:hypothetical protein
MYKWRTTETWIIVATPTNAAGEELRPQYIGPFDDEDEAIANIIVRQNSYDVTQNTRYETRLLLHDWEELD